MAETANPQRGPWDLSDEVHRRLRLAGYYGQLYDMGTWFYYRLGDPSMRVIWQTWETTGPKTLTPQKFDFDRKEWIGANALTVDQFLTSPPPAEFFRPALSILAIARDVLTDRTKVEEEYRPILLPSPGTQPDGQRTEPRTDGARSPFTKDTWLAHIPNPPSLARVGEQEFISRWRGTAAALFPHRVRVLPVTTRDPLRQLDAIMVFEEQASGKKLWHHVHRTTLSRFVSSPDYAPDVDLASLPEDGNQPSRQTGGGCESVAQLVAAIFEHSPRSPEPRRGRTVGHLIANARSPREAQP